METVGTMPSVELTPYASLAYAKIANGLWRFIDVSEGLPNDFGSMRCVGNQYKTKASLLEDMDRYAQDAWGESKKYAVTPTIEKLVESYEKLFPDKHNYGCPTAEATEQLKQSHHEELRAILCGWLNRYIHNPEDAIATQNWYGKVTRALFDAVGIKLPKTKKEMLVMLQSSQFPFSPGEKVFHLGEKRLATVLAIYPSDGDVKLDLSGNTSIADIEKYYAKKNTASTMTLFARFQMNGKRNMEFNNKTTVLEILRAGGSVTLPSGYRLSGDTANLYIDLHLPEGMGRDGACDMSEEGLDNAFGYARQYEKQQGDAN